MNVCTVCKSEFCQQVDAALVANRDSLQAIADRYGLTKFSVLRHKQNHLGDKLASAIAQRDATDGAALLISMDSLVSETTAVLAESKRAKDGKLSLAAIGRLESLARLQADLMTQAASAAGIRRPEINSHTQRNIDDELNALLAKRDAETLARHGIIETTAETME
jgi:hypothetical protein